jgi:hypothetical protein
MLAGFGTARFQRPAAASTPIAMLALALQERLLALQEWLLALQNPLLAHRRATAAETPTEKQKKAAPVPYQGEPAGSDHIPPQLRRQAQQRRRTASP